MQDDIGKQRSGTLRRYISWRRETYRDVGANTRLGLDAARAGLNAFKLLKNAEANNFAFDDKDGGYRRFGLLAAALGENAIQRAIFKWNREAGIFLVAAALSLMLVPAFYVFDCFTKTGAFSLIFLSLAFILLGCRARYRGWQLRQRRMGPLRDYLSRYSHGSTELRKPDDD